MKKLFTTLLIVFSVASYGQLYHQINFDDASSLQYITTDTVNNPNNIWQIGHAQKSFFPLPYSAPNAIITDTLNSYPNNDTSSFIITHYIEPEGGSYEATFLQMKYMVHTDVGNDYLLLDYSGDHGLSWFSLGDSLTGITWDWQDLEFIIYNYNHYTLDYYDTLLFRFTFISDEIQNNMDGVMFDNITIYDEGEGVEENSKSQFRTKVYPDPAEDFTTIAFDNIEKEKHSLKIFNNEGKIINMLETIENKFLLNTSMYSSGIYFYKIENKGNNLQATGKFIKK